jgi:hypothetical protein
MEPAVWRGREAAVGVDTVAARFLPMDSPFDTFLDRAFALNKLEYRLVDDGPGRPRLEALRTLIHRYLEAGTVTVSFWRTPSTLSVDRDVLVEHLPTASERYKFAYRRQPKRYFPSLKRTA